MKKSIILCLLLVTACSRGSGFQDDRARRHVTSNPVCDVSIESLQGFGPRTVEVDQELQLSFPERNAPYALYIEARDTPLNSWELIGVIADVGSTLNVAFPIPGEYRVQAVAPECSTLWGEFFVLGQGHDFGIELLTQAPPNFDIDAFDNSFAKYFDIEVELAELDPYLGFHYELSGLDQAPYGPNNVIDSDSFAVGTSFTLQGALLDPGRYLLRVFANDGTVHERTFQVFGEL